MGNELEIDGLYIVLFRAFFLTIRELSGKGVTEMFFLYYFFRNIVLEKG